MSENNETSIQIDDKDDINPKIKSKSLLKIKYKEEIEKLKLEKDELQDKLLRSMAEVENIRKISRKQVEDSSKYAITNFAKNMLNVLDNLYRASERIPASEAETNILLKNISLGIEMTKKEFNSILEKFSVERIFPEIGTVFDHNYHQAVSDIQVEGLQTGTIAKVLQAGYILHDRLLRPAMVIVAK